MDIRRLSFANLHDHLHLDSLKNSSKEWPQMRRFVERQISKAVTECKAQASHAKKSLIQGMKKSDRHGATDDSDDLDHHHAGAVNLRHAQGVRSVGESSTDKKWNLNRTVRSIKKKSLRKVVKKRHKSLNELYEEDGGDDVSWASDFDDVTPTESGSDAEVSDDDDVDVSDDDGDDVRHPADDDPASMYRYRYSHPASAGHCQRPPDSLDSSCSSSQDHHHPSSSASSSGSSSVHGSTSGDYQHSSSSSAASASASVNPIAAAAAAAAVAAAGGYSPAVPVRAAPPIPSGAISKSSAIQSSNHHRNQSQSTYELNSSSSSTSSAGNQSADIATSTSNRLARLQGFRKIDPDTGLSSSSSVTELTSGVDKTPEDAGGRRKSEGKVPGCRISSGHVAAAVRALQAKGFQPPIKVAIPTVPDVKSPTANEGSKPRPNRALSMETVLEDSHRRLTTSTAAYEPLYNLQKLVNGHTDYTPIFNGKSDLIEMDRISSSSGVSGSSSSGTGHSGRCREGSERSAGSPSCGTRNNETSSESGRESSIADSPSVPPRSRSAGAVQRRAAAAAAAAAANAGPAGPGPDRQLGPNGKPPIKPKPSRDSLPPIQLRNKATNQSAGVSGSGSGPPGPGSGPGPGPKKTPIKRPPTEPPPPPLPKTSPPESVTGPSSLSLEVSEFEIPPIPVDSPPDSPPPLPKTRPPADSERHERPDRVPDRPQYLSLVLDGDIEPISENIIRPPAEWDDEEGYLPPINSSGSRSDSGSGSVGFLKSSNPLPLSAAISASRQAFLQRPDPVSSGSPLPDYDSDNNEYEPINEANIPVSDPRLLAATAERPLLPQRAESVKRSDGHHHNHNHQSLTSGKLKMIPNAVQELFANKTDGIPSRFYPVDANQIGMTMTMTNTHDNLSSPVNNRPLPPVPVEELFGRPTSPGGAGGRSSSKDDGRRRSGLVDNYSWFVQVGREEAERVLRSLGQEGGYLVRESERGGENAPFSLSIYHADRIFHLNVRRRPDELFALGKPKSREKTFESIGDLIAYHRHEPILLTSNKERAGRTRLEVTPKDFAKI